MLLRVSLIALNTYREAVRARILLGLFALAVATGGYSLVVGAFASRSSLRVVSDLGAASVSLYAIAVAVVMTATSLHREVELKTVFPILARPIRRTEYLVGKYVGTVATLAVFVAGNSGILLLALAAMAGESIPIVLAVGLGSAAAAAVVAWRRVRWRSYLPIAWVVVLVCAGWSFAAGVPDDRRVILFSAALTLLEVSIVAAVATVFASFSSPFLTAVFTYGVFIVGRSADTLGNLPYRVFGHTIVAIGKVVSKIVPPLMVYVPPRPLLTGESAQSIGRHLLLALGMAVAWSVLLLALASIVFRRRDFL